MDALAKEKNPITETPCFHSALLSRFAKGKMIALNRLNGQTLCEIIKAKVAENIEKFHARYPMVQVECDALRLAQTLIFSKGCEGDARGLTADADRFFASQLFKAMQRYEEEGEDFDEIDKIEFSFDFLDCEERARKLFFSKNDYKIAVYCSEEEREAFAECDWLDLRFVTFDESVSSLYYDCAIVSVDVYKNKDAFAYFRKIRKQEDVPVYAFTLDKAMNRTDLKAYYYEGAEGVFLPKNGGSFLQWLEEIKRTLRFSKIASDLGRANLALRYDTFGGYTILDGRAVLQIKTRNYRLERVMYAQDEKAFVADHEIPDVKFSDVKGLDATVSEVRDLMDVIQNHKEYKRLGIKTPRGLLFHGNPGTGKTLLAKAIASESGMPFIERNATEYLKPVVGEGKDALKKDFALARKYAPAVLFIDEIDAFAKNRAFIQTAETSSMVLNAFLSEMDGFAHDEKKPVFVIGATNFDPCDGTNALDPAFVRRFDRRIKVQLPDSKSRMEILEYFLEKHSVELPKWKLQSFVQRSLGKSPSDLEQIVECAVRQSVGRRLGMEDLNNAFETISYGDKKEWSAEVVRKTSYHEAGHALVAWLTGNTPAYVTNVSRGSYGGYMQYESEEDKLAYSRQDVLDKICVSFAGRVAEQLVYGEAGVTTGANADIAQARKLAFAMVDDYAMEEDFLLGAGESLSESTRQAIDLRVNAILKEQYGRAKALLAQNQVALEMLVDKLIRENSLDSRQIEELLQFVERRACAEKEEEVNMK
jgi:ATP-dependent Zn protease